MTCHLLRTRRPAPLAITGLATLVLVGAAQRAEAIVTSNVVANQLVVSGDGVNNVIRLRLAAGNATQVEVLDNGVVIGTFDRATFATISITGGAGDDSITIDDVNGVFTDTEISIPAAFGRDVDDLFTAGGQVGLQWRF